MNRDPLTEQVIGCAIEVHRALGPGLLEAVYEECFCHELHENGLGFQRQIPVPVTYKAVNLETGFRADMVIEKELLIEIKAVERLLPVHQAQMLTYLKLSGIPKGRLLNFNTRVLTDCIRRFVM